MAVGADVGDQGRAEGEGTALEGGEGDMAGVG